MVQICFTKRTSGRGGYLHTGSQLHPTRRGAQIESGGLSVLTPHPGTPIPGTVALIGVLGRISVTSQVDLEDRKSVEINLR